MNLLQRILRRLTGRHSTNVETTGKRFVPTAEERALIEEYFRLSAHQRQVTPSPGRQPTDEELAVAAWANLAVEEPSVTMEDARRAVAKLRDQNPEHGWSIEDKVPHHAGAGPR